MLAIKIQRFHKNQTRRKRKHNLTIIFCMFKNIPLAHEYWHIKIWWYVRNLILARVKKKKKKNVVNRILISRKERMLRTHACCVQFLVSRCDICEKLNTFHKPRTNVVGSLNVRHARVFIKKTFVRWLFR